MMRSTVAAMTPIRMALLRCSFGKTGRREADHDGVVAGQHQVDHHHLQEGGDFRREKFVHAMPLLMRARTAQPDRRTERAFTV